MIFFVFCRHHNGIQGSRRTFPQYGEAQLQDASRRRTVGVLRRAPRHQTT